MRIESSRAGMTPSDLKPMSSRTSSWSIFTTVPVDQVAVFELEDAVADEGGEVGADQVVFGDDARNVVSVFVKGAHLLGGEEAGAVRHAYFFHTTTPGSD